MPMPFYYKAFFDLQDSPILFLDESLTVVAINPPALRLNNWNASNVTNSSYVRLCKQNSVLPTVTNFESMTNNDIIKTKCPNDKNRAWLWKVNIIATENLRGIILTATEDAFCDNMFNQITEKPSMCEKNKLDYAIRVKNYLENIIASTPGNIYWVNREGISLGCNDNVAKMYGFSSRHEIVGKSYAQLASLMNWDAGQAESFMADDQAVMTTGKAKYNVEEPPITDANGKNHYFLTTRVPILKHNKEIIGVVGTSIDITERKEMETALINAKEKAEIANKAKEEFLFNMRHDIRTPFASIIGMSLLLRDMEQDEEKLRYINNIYVASGALLAYLNTILEFTKNGEGSAPIASMPLNVKKTVQSCISIFMPEMEIKKIQLHADFDEILENNYCSDHFRLKRIFVNLIGNAVKFTNEGGEIRVSANVINAKNNSDVPIVRIEIKDNGIGIPPDKYDVIFDKFVRLTSSYKDKYKGSGLGLYAVKTLLDDLNGTVKVLSQIGKGSKFTCDIPMKLVDGAAPIKTAAVSAQDDRLPHTANQQVLVVEDVMIIQLVQSTLFKNLNCFVDVADSGEEALNFCQEKIYDLILMDIGLPGIDGFETTRKIRQLPNGKLVPIIGLTAHAADEINNESLNAGMNKTLSKPLTKEQALLLLK